MVNSIRFRSVAIALVVAVAIISPAMADVKLSSLFSDNCVLQQGMAAPVWGTAAPGEQVTVTLGEAKASATAGSDGKWTAKIGPLKAGGPLEMTVAGKNTITVKNVLVGDVWVCSGQSNMQWALNAAANGPAEAAQADYPSIRYYAVPRSTFASVIDDANSHWVVCSPDTAKGFSAVGYFFGRELHKKLSVPVGLIGCAWGGMPAQTYTPREAMEHDALLKPIVDEWRKSVTEFPAQRPKLMEDYQQALAKWKATTQAAATAPADANKPVARAPQPPADPATAPNSPGVLWNSMIHPLLPYGIAGAIWYQGEADAGRSYVYRALFPFMIQQWRKAWGQGDFPFLFVQLANYMPIAATPDAPTNWAPLREAQTMTLALPKTAMAVTIDIGETASIHPTNKQEVGRRLALGALKVAYNQDVAYASPMYESMAVEGDKVVVKFKNIGGGLAAKDADEGVKQGAGQVKWFAVAGKDHVFHWATATIQGNDTVVVTCDKVAEPVAVRYAWANNPMGCNLYSKEGLPACPFRSDDWPVQTSYWPLSQPATAPSK